MRGGYRLLRSVVFRTTLHPLGIRIRMTGNLEDLEMQDIDILVINPVKTIVGIVRRDISTMNQKSNTHLERNTYQRCSLHLVQILRVRLLRLERQKQSTHS